EATENSLVLRRHLHELSRLLEERAIGDVKLRFFLAIDVHDPEQRLSSHHWHDAEGADELLPRINRGVRSAARAHQREHLSAIDGDAHDARIARDLTLKFRLRAPA